MNHSSVFNDQKSNQQPLDMQLSDQQPRRNCGPLTSLHINQIDQSDDFSFREKNCLETVDRYAERWTEYKEELANPEAKPEYPFPAIVVLKIDENKYIVVSGVHRLLSAKKAGLAEILCFVLTDREKAILCGLHDNRAHGLQLSGGDKRKCILLALKEFDGKMSHRDIARLVGCSHTYVNRISSLETSFQQHTDLPTAPPGLKYHPLTKAFPRMEDADSQRLKESIEKLGVLVPIYLYKGKILDGRERYEIAQAANLPCPMKVFDGATDDDALDFIISMNLSRQRFFADQIEMIDAEILKRHGDKNTDETPDATGVQETIQKHEKKSPGTRIF